MKPLNILLLSLAVSVFSGCATGNTSIANESAQTLQQKLVKGKTTKAEVRAAFGEPSDKGVTDGTEYWGYQMAEASAKSFIPFAILATGTSGTSGKYLRVTFDKKGLVKSSEMTESKF